jgi:hypothetical protein
VIRQRGNDREGHSKSWVMVFLRKYASCYLNSLVVVHSKRASKIVCLRETELHSIVLNRTSIQTHIGRKNFSILGSVHAWKHLYKFQQNLDIRNCTQYFFWLKSK